MAIQVGRKTSLSAILSGTISKAVLLICLLYLCHEVVTAAHTNKYLMGVVVILCSLILYPQFRSKIEFYYRESNSRNRDRIMGCASLAKGRYYPTPYLANGFMQAFYSWITTVVTDYFGVHLQFKSENVVLPNGVLHHIEWAYLDPAQPIRPTKTLVVILPGISSDNTDGYVRQMAIESLERGHKTVLFNNRWSGDSLTLNTPARYSEDLRHFLQYLTQNYPQYNLFAVGHSWGANTLINYLGTFPEDQYLQGAVAASCPYDFTVGAQEVETTTVYKKFLLDGLKKTVRRYEHEIKVIDPKRGFNIAKALETTSILEFDHSFSKNLCGYESLEEYYREISCVHKMESISIPLLLLSARDDPLVKDNMIPYEACQLNDNIILAVTNSGGHVGWYEGILKPMSWYPKPVLEFFEVLAQETK